MIISRTPFRVSFAGGGSDLKAYYGRRPGAVVSAAIDKYMYVTVNRRFDQSVRVSYTKTEIVESADQVHHDLARAAMQRVGVSTGVEITTIADVPAGTGLGSSSSLTVGLLHALYAYQGKFCPSEELARQACEIEIDILQRPIGKQDQYAAACGGLNYIQFNADGTVFVDPIICSPAIRRELDRRLMLFYVGPRGDNSKLLAEQKQSTMSNTSAQENLDQMVGLAKTMRDALNQDDLTTFGEVLHQGWVLKKRMNAAISNSEIDRWYQAARDGGATGGKILGAGGAGFLLLYSSDGAQPAVRAAMQSFGLREFPVRFAPQGSKIVFVGDQQWEDAVETPSR